MKVEIVLKSGRVAVILDVDRIFDTPGSTRLLVENKSKDLFYYSWDSVEAYSVLNDEGGQGA